MSMNLVLWRISKDKLHSLMGNPVEAAAFFDAPWPEAFDAQSPCFNMGKAWAVVDFLLTGYPYDDAERPDSPLGHAICGGQESPWECSYGKVCILDHNEVKSVWDALAPVEETDVEGSFDVDELNALSLYPAYERWSDDYLPFVVESVARLRIFYRQAAERDEAVLIGLW